MHIDLQTELHNGTQQIYKFLYGRMDTTGCLHRVWGKGNVWEQLEGEVSEDQYWFSCPILIIVKYAWTDFFVSTIPPFQSFQVFTDH
jgi:hypothetical protein